LFPLVRSPSSAIAGLFGNGQRRELAVAEPDISARQLRRLDVKWAFGIPGVVAMFGQHTIVGDRVFIGGLSPRIIAAIADGTAPADLTVTRLAKALPYSWAEQERATLRNT
jgi:hypothetical protein